MTAPGATRGGSNFNPRAPCGARREFSKAAGLPEQKISILAPLAGRDEAELLVSGLEVLFQSSRPLRGATILAKVLGL